MKKQLFLFMLGAFFLTACSNKTADTTDILYSGTVAEINADSILMSELTPVADTDAPAFTEVILLTTPPDDLKKGDTLEVTLIENAPTTRSLPPQIPGNSIVEVRVSKD